MNSQSLYTITQVLIANFLIALSFSACLFVFKFFFFTTSLRQTVIKLLTKMLGSEKNIRYFKPLIR